MRERNENGRQEDIYGKPKVNLSQAKNSSKPFVNK